MESKNILLGLIGVAASGKTEIARYVVEKYGFLYISSITSRPVRPGNESEYVHLSKEEFENHIKNDEVLEYTTFNDNYYGKLKKTVFDCLEKGHCVYTLTTDRAEELKKLYDNTLIILVEPQEPILDTVERRMHGRAVHHPDEVKAKLKTVIEELEIIKDLKEKGVVDYKVTTVDSDHELALREIDGIIENLIA